MIAVSMISRALEARDIMEDRQKPGDNYRTNSWLMSNEITPACKSGRFRLVPGIHL